ncbi:MAG: flavodoxin family protein [Acidobacteriota bacterium]
MQALVVYDSVYGNTERVAHAIGNILAARNEIRVRRVGDVHSTDLANLNLLIVGSPTQQFRATPAIKKFIGGIRKGELKNVQVAAFDTRLGMEDMPSRILPPFVKIFGYAAKPISDSLVNKGGKLVTPPEGFLVKGMEGPLKEGELERAATWAEHLLSAA